MEYRKAVVALIAFVALIVVALVATGIKALNNAAADSARKGDPCPCSGPGEARERGVFVCSARIEPNELTWQGNRIAFNEVWLEEAGEPAHFLVWFPYYKRLGGYYLCFTLADGMDAIYQFHPSFLVEGRDDGFGWLHPSAKVVFFRPLKEADFPAMRMSLVSDRRNPRPNNITIRRTVQD